MRIYVTFAICAPLLLPIVAAADPAQPQAPAAMAPASGQGMQAGATSQTAPTTLTQGTVAPAASPKAAPATTQAPAAPSQAAMQTGPESVVVKADAVDLNQVVCKELPPKVGSRLGGGRECHTQREWNQQMRESQDITRHQQITGYVH